MLTVYLNLSVSLRVRAFTDLILTPHAYFKSNTDYSERFSQIYNTHLTRNYILIYTVNSIHSINTFDLSRSLSLTQVISLIRPTWSLISRYLFHILFNLSDHLSFTVLYHKQLFISFFSFSSLSLSSYTLSY